MNKVAVEEVQVGSTIAMLGGVVRVASFEADGEGIILGVSIGRLVNHPMPFKAGSHVEVVNMPANLAPWYGV